MFTSVNKIDFDINVFIQASPWTLRLAQILYMKYSEELMQTIKEDEAEFIKVYHEIQDIQAGKHDNELKPEEV